MCLNCFDPEGFSTREDLKAGGGVLVLAPVGNLNSKNLVLHLACFCEPDKRTSHKRTVAAYPHNQQSSMIATNKSAARIRPRDCNDQKPLANMRSNEGITGLSFICKPVENFAEPLAS